MTISFSKNTNRFPGGYEEAPIMTPPRTPVGPGMAGGPWFTGDVPLPGGSRGAPYNDRWDLPSPGGFALTDGGGPGGVSYEDWQNKKNLPPAQYPVDSNIKFGGVPINDWMGMGQPGMAPPPSGIPGGIGDLTPAPAGQRSPYPWMSDAFFTGMDDGKNLWQEMSMDSGYYKPAMENIMGRFEDRLGGLNSQEMEAARGQAQNKIGGEYQTGMRNLLSNQARSGVRGAAAQAGMMDLADRRGTAQGDFEGQMLLKNNDIMRQALTDYQSAVTGERFGQLGTQMGMAGIYGGQQAQQDTNEILKGMYPQFASYGQQLPSYQQYPNKLPGRG